MSTHPLVQSISNFKDEAVQHSKTIEANELLFSNENNRKNTFLTINDFIDNYLTNGLDVPLDEWLLNRFSEFPEVWKDNNEKQRFVNTIISTLDTLIQTQLELEKALNKGKTIPNFINKKINNIAETYEVDPQEIGKGIQKGLQQGNQNTEQFYFGEIIPENSENLQIKGMNLAREINEKIKLSAQLNLANGDIKIVTSNLLKDVIGDKFTSKDEELTKIIRSPIDSKENKAIQATISAAVIIAAKLGWVNGVFENTEEVDPEQETNKVEELTLNVADGYNDVRILDKIEQGLYKLIDAVAEKAKFSTAKILTEVEQIVSVESKKIGVKIGFALGTAIGSLVSPAAATMVGNIGGVVGEKVGEFVGNEVVKPALKLTREIAYKAIDAVECTAKTVVSLVKEGTQKAWDGIKNVSSKVVSFFGL